MIDCGSTAWRRYATHATIARAARLFPCLAAFATFSACVDTTEPVLILDAPATIVHASSETPRLDVVIDGRSRAHLRYGQATDRFAVRVGQRRVRAYIEGTRTLLMDTEITVRRDAQHTIIAAGSNQVIEPWILVDDAIPPVSGTAHVRVVHAAGGAGAVDIYVTPPSDPLPTALPRVAAVAFGSVSDYMVVDAAEYRVRVTAAGTQTVLAELPRLELGSRRVCTLVIIERTGGNKLVILDG